jgi:ComF family protein
LSVKATARSLFDLFLPRGCLACGDRIPPEEREGLVCGRCRSRLRGPPPPHCDRCQIPLGTGGVGGEDCPECSTWSAALSRTRSAVVLDPVAGAMVHALKYRGWSELAEVMARRMTSAMPQTPPGEILVPVPTTPWRRRTRGYNQAELLARALGRALSLPTVAALYRESGRTQVHLGPRERLANVRSAFAVRKGIRSRIRGRDVIVVDDVLTTGATANAAATTLVSGGAASVRVVTFARSLPYTETVGG